MAQLLKEFHYLVFILGEDFTEAAGFINQRSSLEE
jgi:hypothetical protein